MATQYKYTHVRWRRTPYLDAIEAKINKLENERAELLDEDPNKKGPDLR